MISQIESFSPEKELSVSLRKQLSQLEMRRRQSSVGMAAWPQEVSVAAILEGLAERSDSRPIDNDAVAYDQQVSLSETTSSVQQHMSSPMAKLVDEEFAEVGRVRKLIHLHQCAHLCVHLPISNR